jgi:hypothetical protein
LALVTRVRRSVDICGPPPPPQQVGRLIEAQLFQDQQLKTANRYRFSARSSGGFTIPAEAIVLVAKDTMAEFGAAALVVLCVAKFKVARRTSARARREQARRVA